MFIPELFGPAPTFTHDALAGTAQPYGSSTLPGAPVSQPTMSPAGFIPPINIPIYPPQSDGVIHIGGFIGDIPIPAGPTVEPTTGGTDAPTGQRHLAPPSGPASDTGSGGMIPTNPVTIAPQTSTAGNAVAGTTTPKDATGASDVVGRLIDLASSQQGGGGGGGLVALPTGIATTDTGSSGGGISKATLFLLIALVAIGVYFYSRHKKKNAAKGGEKGGEKND